MASRVAVRHRYLAYRRVVPELGLCAREAKAHNQGAIQALKLLVIQIALMARQPLASDRSQLVAKDCPVLSQQTGWQGNGVRVRLGRDRGRNRRDDDDGAVLVVYVVRDDDSGPMSTLL